MNPMHASRREKILASVVVSMLLLSIGACASVPYQEMSDARQAIDSARPVVADHPGPSEQVSEARELLKKAEAHLEAGEYTAARKVAEEAKALAIEARENAESMPE